MSFFFNLFQPRVRNQAREEVELTWDDEDEAVAPVPAPLPVPVSHAADGAVAVSLQHASVAAAVAVDATAPAAALVEAPVAAHLPPSDIVSISNSGGTEESTLTAPIVLAAVAEVSNAVAGASPASAEALADHSAANSMAVSKVDAAPEPVLAVAVPPTLVSAVADSVGADASASVASSPSPSSLRTPNVRSLDVSGLYISFKCYQIIKSHVIFFFPLNNFKTRSGRC